jgi:hypothetical protein
MDNRRESDLLGDGHRLVAARVVDENNVVNDLAVKLGHRTQERGFRVIGGQHNAYSTRIDHW